MKTLQNIKDTLSGYLPKLIKKYHLKEIGIFGSYVKNMQTEKSDVDILVDFEEIPSLFDFVDLKIELSDILGLNVDLVMKNSLKPRIGQRILQEVILL
jgi:predicted nucleotidyltransferase